MKVKICKVLSIQQVIIFKSIQLFEKIEAVKTVAFSAASRVTPCYLLNLDIEPLPWAASSPKGQKSAVSVRWKCPTSICLMSKWIENEKAKSRLKTGPILTRQVFSLPAREGLEGLDLTFTKYFIQTIHSANFHWGLSNAAKVLIYLQLCEFIN